MNPLSRTYIFSSSSCSSFNCFTAQASSLQIEGTLNETVDRNFEILRFCEEGNLEKAMELLLQWEKIDLDIRTYCSILQMCAKFKSLNCGKKVHSVVRSRNIIIDGVLGSKLVFMYVSCGDLKEGRRIFDKTATENVFLWNLLMNEYAKIGNFKESVYLYHRMTELGIEANSYTFSCVLKCFAALGSLDEGKMIHGCLLKSGFHNVTTVMNSLISLYFKTGRIESAEQLFDELSDRDVVSWNSMISGFVANGLAQQGAKVFVEMLNLGVGVDLATIVIVLAACAKTDNLSFTRSIHAYAIKAGFDMKITFSNSLLDTYSKCGDMQGAVCVFQCMPDRSIVSWTSMLAGYARQGLYNEAVVLFHEMRKKGIELDAFAVTSILHACASSGSLENGKKVHEYIKESNMESSLFVSNALMDMYAKCGSMEDAKMVFFSRMKAKDIVSWNTIIGGFSKNNLPNEALDLFVEMQNHVRPDCVTITCILPTCASLAALDKGREIHGYIMRSGFSSDRFVCNALLDMYVKCGALLVAKLLFNKIASKDLVSWTTMIAGYGMYGFGTEAIATFNDMRQAGIMPDELSFTCILYSCSHSGSLDEGWKFFDIMRKEYGIEAKLEHYACMVDLLARAGRLLEAYKFIQKMPVQPDATVWAALLSGCRIHHDVKLAEEVADHIFELEPENTGYYILLANIYAEAEKWEEVKKMREKIGMYSLNKNPGYSWIEIKGKVEVFVSRDNSFPEAKRTRAFLKNLRKKMKEEGHSSRIRYALINDADDDREKEISLCGHSEKLAMAFGIMKLPRGKVIRVTKNASVCGDCHEMAKFMSKSLGREIVLRDSNRFHYFRDGSCSCRDYW